MEMWYRKDVRGRQEFMNGVVKRWKDLMKVKVDLIKE